ncbi:MAG: HAMP domain-containing histidine kinase [Lachnospiraceae bacterium]|nr:HAMP domain-containing histidine kinase [Lachnospiraceae bacterium]
MRHKLSLKFLFGYLVFGIFGFLIVALVSSNLTYGYLVKSHARQLYDEAYYLASYYRSAYQDSSGFDEQGLADRADAVSAYFRCHIWVILRNGDVLFDSTKEHTGIQIGEFDPTDKKNEIYTISDFYGVFDEEALSVAAPIAGNFSTYGYVILFLPMKQVLTTRDQILNIVYITSGIIFLCSFLFLAMFQRMVGRPLAAITKAAKEYAVGNLNYQVALATEDEMGYLADTLTYMASELSDMEETQRKFISNISHDFRSPLTSIKGYLEAMIDGTIPPEMYDKYMHIVISETERLARLTTSTLALQSLESNGTILDLENFDINHVIKETALAFEGPCHQKHIVLDLTFSDDSMYVYADKLKIQQVLYNLIDNAIKFSKEKSTIWLETYDQSGRVFVSVKDTGVGIPKNSLKKIWSRFYKADNSRGKDKKGTGLGLAICKEILTAHNQTIDVISTEGIGSEFIFTLKKGIRL